MRLSSVFLDHYLVKYRPAMVTWAKLQRLQEGKMDDFSKKTERSIRNIELIINLGRQVRKEKERAHADRQNIVSINKRPPDPNPETRVRKEKAQQ
jgi:hypothetical protein